MEDMIYIRAKCSEVFGGLSRMAANFGSGNLYRNNEINLYMLVAILYLNFSSYNALCHCL